MSILAQTLIILIVNPSFTHLFCTLISENQGLDKFRSVSNLRKISVHAHLNFFLSSPEFFFSLSPEFFFWDLYHKPEKNPGDKLKKKLRCTEKKFRCAGPEIFLRFERDLDLSRPWFSEIKVQNKWLYDYQQIHEMVSQNFCNNESTNF